jgi:hypothetical protein
VITGAANARDVSSRGRLRLLGDCGEGFRIGHGQIGQHLPVQRNLRLPAAGDELVVREPVLPGRGVDPQDPEPAELALAVLPIAVGVGKRVLDLLFRLAVARVLEAPVALGLLSTLRRFLRA